MEKESHHCFLSGCYRYGFIIIITLAENLNLRPLVAHCRLGIGRLHSRIGDLETARRDLATAADIYNSLGMQKGAGETQQALSELSSPN